MRANMIQDGAGLVDNVPSRVAQGAAEIDIFEPTRIKAFVKAFDALQRDPAEGWRGDSEVLDGLGAAVINFQIPVRTVLWISVASEFLRNPFSALRHMLSN